MTRFALLAATAVALALSAAADAAVNAYSATLSGASENPANASPGSGSTTLFYDTSAHTLRVVVTFTGLTSGTTASHIHCCTAPPGNAGVATTTPTFPGFPLGVTAGTYDRTLDLTSPASWNAAFISANGGTPAGAEAALAAGLAAGRAYLNVHTSNFPAGELRGFLGTPPSAAAVSSAIPTLSDAGLIVLIAAIALTALAAARRARA
jgi:hypothetical protein